MLNTQRLIAWLAFCQSFVTSQYIEIGSGNNSRIGKPAIGGNVVSLGDLPHSAVVIGKTGKCTASIIHHSWVLTAAHCVSDPHGNPVQSSDIQVMAGVIDFKTPGPSAQKRQGLKIIIHQGYQPQQIGKYDIALVKVDPFQLNNYVKVIGFASKEWPQDRRMLNRSCTSAGWGMLANRETTSYLHSQRTIAKHGLDSCPCLHKGYVLKRIICLAAESTVGICFGDSGGALICDGEIVGVAHMVMDKRSCSYFKSPESTIYCESAYVYGMYIFTCPLLNWIREYVPGVPPTPASCKANISTPIFSLVLLLILFFIVKN